MIPSRAVDSTRHSTPMHRPHLLDHFSDGLPRFPQRIQPRFQQPVLVLQLFDLFFALLVALCFGQFLLPCSLTYVSCTNPSPQPTAHSPQPTAHHIHKRTHKRTHKRQKKNSCHRRWNGKDAEDCVSLVRVEGEEEGEGKGETATRSRLQLTWQRDDNVPCAHIGRRCTPFGSIGTVAHPAAGGHPFPWNCASSRVFPV